MASEDEGRVVELQFTWKRIASAIRPNLDKTQDPVMMVFINHPSSALSTHVIPLPTTLGPTKVRFILVPNEATHVGFWLYAKDFVLSDRNHPSWALQALAYVPLAQDVPDTQLIELVEMGNNNKRIKVAEFQLDFLHVTRSVNSTRFVVPEWIEAYHRSVNDELFNKRQNALIVDKVLTSSLG